MKSTKNFLKFLFLLSICTSVFFACQKETTFLNETKTERSSLVINRSSTTNVNLTPSQTPIAGGDIDDVILNIENQLNQEYSYPDQSIGEVVTSELEIPVSSNATTEEAINLYNQALAQLSRTYYLYDNPNREVLSVDLERLDNSNRVNINIWIGEAQANANVVPCDQTTFADISFSVPKFSSAPTGTVFAGDELSKALNKKLVNNPCIYFTNVKELNLTSSQYLINTSSASLSKSQLEDAYCKYLKMLQGLALPTGYAIQSVVVKGNMLTCGGCGGVLIITVKIGIPTLKAPCKPQKVIPPAL